jgi:hypothetical protein
MEHRVTGENIDISFTTSPMDVWVVYLSALSLLIFPYS